MEYYFKQVPQKNSKLGVLLKINIFLLFAILFFVIWGLFFYTPPKDHSGVLAEENTQLKIRIAELEAAVDSVPEVIETNDNTAEIQLGTDE